MSRVCVAISVRNGEEYLGVAIESVLGQTHADLELRIYDNLSTDGSRSIAESYLADSRVSYAANDRDLGYYGSLNRALDETRCELFVPFAADDVMEAGNLEAKVALMADPAVGFAYSPVMLIDPAGADIGELGRIPNALPRYAAGEFFSRCAPVNCVTCPSVVLRSAALRALGGFDGRVPYCADWLAWMRLSLRHGVAFVDSKLVRWRQHPQSGTSDSLRSAVYASEDPAALEFALADGGLEPAVADAYLAACLARTATLLERDGHSRTAAGHGAYGLAIRALELAPGERPLQELASGMSARAGLRPAQSPYHLVLSAGSDSGLLAEGIRAARRLDAGGLLASFAVHVRPDELDDAVAVLEPLLAAGPATGIDLVPAASAEELLVPGTLAYVPWSSPEAELAESLGIPTRTLGAPNPLRRPPDPARFETILAA
jgi:glycosyltransferase involved in cell wall biosynthesis